MKLLLLLMEVLDLLQLMVVVQQRGCIKDHVHGRVVVSPPVQLSQEHR